MRWRRLSPRPGAGRTGERPVHDSRHRQGGGRRNCGDRDNRPLGPPPWRLQQSGTVQGSLGQGESGTQNPGVTRSQGFGSNRQFEWSQDRQQVPGGTDHQQMSGGLNHKQVPGGPNHQQVTGGPWTGNLGNWW